ncbi:MAG: OmpH family outer membrane protein [Bacteroidetes bacterium]|nr:OmpH family outer membrane protein [Bacteroidota bacterium]MBS1648905.1 OmpH family outer membrane protein [Bacteroidota bacterium]
MKKKLIFTTCFIIVILFANNTHAQQVKIGVFDEQQILPLMPGIERVDSLMKIFATDSLAAEYDVLMADYKLKDSLLKRDTAIPNNITPALKQKRVEEINNLKGRVLTWQQYQNEKYQTKQREYLAPYLQKIYDALQAVINEQKYTYILKPDAIFWANQSDELALRVLGKLKIPLSKELADRVKAVTTPPASTTPKPQPKTKH